MWTTYNSCVSKPRRSALQRWFEFFLALALYAVYLNGLVIVLSHAHATQPWWLALGLRLGLVFGGTILLLKAIERWGGRFFERNMAPLCMVVAAFAGFICGGQNYYSTYLWLDRGDNVDGVSIAKANEYPDASFMRLENAVFRGDLAVYHRWYASSDDDQLTHYHAAPIVPPDWQPGDSILVWAVHEGRQWPALEQAPEGVRTQGMIEDNHRYLRTVLRANGRTLNPFAIALEPTNLPYEAQVVLMWRNARWMFWLLNGIALGMWIIIIGFTAHPPWQERW